jgi:hypothetical protein
MAHHEPCPADEQFLGNCYYHTNGIPLHLKTLKTLRIGQVAYDLDGKEIPEMRPLFIKRTEAFEYDHIMTRRFSAIRRGITTE